MKNQTVSFGTSLDKLDLPEGLAAYAENVEAATEAVTETTAPAAISVAVTWQSEPE